MKEFEQQLDISKKIAARVAERGGRAYYVGGFVRDRVLKSDLRTPDIDIEVHGVEPEKLFQLLKDLGEPLAFA